MKPRVQIEHPRPRVARFLVFTGKVFVSNPSSDNLTDHSFFPLQPCISIGGVGAASSLLGNLMGC